MKTLKAGSAGAHVELWQSFLNRTGYPVVAVDGIFGVQTQKATKAFQKANKLIPDGIVGNATLAVAISRGFKPRAENYVIAEIAGKKDPVLPPTRQQVFISYSHKDTRWREDLEKRLKPFLRAGSIKSWSDKQISPGSKWFAEIKSAMADTKIAVLLVSPDFLASDFIHEHELGPLLKEAEQGGVKILWVHVRASGYEQTPLADYQAVLDPSRPLAGMTTAKRDQAWVEICKEIQGAVNKRLEPLPPLPSAAPPAVSQGEIMHFLMLKRQELDSRPELLTVIRLLEQEREARQGKGSRPEGPKNEEEGNRWRELPRLLESIGTFLEYNSATREAYRFFSEEVLLCAESSLLWPPKERYDETVFWRSFNKFVKATKDAGYALPPL